MPFLFLIAQIISLFWAIALPAVGTSLYFHEKAQPDEEAENTEKTAIGKKPTSRVKFSGKTAAVMLWTHFQTSYSDVIVVQWSLWWALAMCGFMQVCKWTLMSYVMRFVLKYIHI